MLDFLELRPHLLFVVFACFLHTSTVVHKAAASCHLNGHQFFRHLSAIQIGYQKGAHGAANVILKTLRFEAVRLVTDQGHSLTEVASRWGVRSGPGG